MWENVSERMCLGQDVGEKVCEIRFVGDVYRRRYEKKCA